MTLGNSFYGLNWLDFLNKRNSMIIIIIINYINLFLNLFIYF